MNFLSTLKIEGTETYQVLAYFYGSIETMDLALSNIRALFEAEKYKVSQLYDTDWPIGVVLVEAIFSDPAQAAPTIVGLGLSATGLNGIIGSVCMFDGVFCGIEEVFSPSYAEQIYSVWIWRGELNLAMDGAVRSSCEWKEVIANFRRALGL